MYRVKYVMEERDIVHDVMIMCIFDAIRCFNYNTTTTADLLVITPSPQMIRHRLQLWTSWRP